MNQPIEIPLSKGKVIFGIVGSIGFVILGFGLFTQAESVSDNVIYSKIVQEKFAEYTAE